MLIPLFLACHPAPDGVPNSSARLEIRPIEGQVSVPTDAHLQIHVGGDYLEEELDLDLLGPEGSLDFDVSYLLDTNQDTLATLTPIGTWPAETPLDLVASVLIHPDGDRNEVTTSFTTGSDTAEELSVVLGGPRPQLTDRGDGSIDAFIWSPTLEEDTTGLALIEVYEVEADGSGTFVHTGFAAEQIDSESYSFIVDGVLGEEHCFRWAVRDAAGRLGEVSEAGCSEVQEPLDDELG